MRGTLKRLAGRLAGIAFTLWAVFTITFALMLVVPGGPFDREKPIPESIKRNMEARYGLDDPVPVRYFRQMKNLVTLNFDPSYTMEDFNVGEIIGSGLPISASLGLVSLTLALCVGMVAGVISAVRRGTPYDVGLMVLATLGIAVPNFVVAGLVVIVVSFWLQWLPPAGWGTVRQLILPAVCLAAPYAAYIARLTRSGMLEVLNLDYVRTAYAKGLPSRTVVLRHALRGALLPVITYLGPAAAGILTGSVVIEQVFNVPGLASHFIQSAAQRDWTLLTWLVMVYTLLLSSMNLLVDLSYAMIDPRIKEGD